MKKLLKWLAALAIIGTAAGILAVYLSRTHTDTDSRTNHSAEEDDFDLDHDLQPVAEREYVPLKKAEDNSAETTKAEKDSADTTEAESDSADTTSKE